MPVPLHPGAESYYKEKGADEVSVGASASRRGASRRRADARRDPKDSDVRRRPAINAPVLDRAAPSDATHRYRARPAAGWGAGLPGRVLFWIARRASRLFQLADGGLRHPAEPVLRAVHVGFLVLVAGGR